MKKRLSLNQIICNLLFAGKVPVFVTMSWTGLPAWKPVMLTIIKLQLKSI